MRAQGRPPRRAVPHLVDAVRGLFEGRVVLVTGAGGQLGAELCRQIADQFPARLLLLDHDDRRLAMTQVILGRRRPNEWNDLLLVDVRDQSTLCDLMAVAAPDVVIHAALLRDPDLLERYPREAWATNVAGTRNMLEAATAAGAGTFVTVTRPGPVGADSVASRTQVEAERLTSAYAEINPGQYLAVRLPHSAATALPLGESCRLILEAAAHGSDGLVIEAMPGPVGVA